MIKPEWIAATTLGILASATTSALAAPLPYYDIEAHCRKVAGVGEGFSYSAMRTCMRQERQAKQQYKRLKVERPTYKHCNSIASVGTGGSYSALVTCIQQEREAKQQAN